MLQNKWVRWIVIIAIIIAIFWLVRLSGHATLGPSGVSAGPDGISAQSPSLNVGVDRH